LVPGNFPATDIEGKAIFVLVVEIKGQANCLVLLDCVHDCRGSAPQGHHIAVPCRLDGVVCKLVARRQWAAVEIHRDIVPVKIPSHNAAPPGL
jgi:hypothetical protein